MKRREQNERAKEEKNELNNIGDAQVTMKNDGSHRRRKKKQKEKTNSFGMRIQKA